jgi:hypothetical protein
MVSPESRNQAAELDMVSPESGVVMGFPLVSFLEGIDIAQRREVILCFLLEAKSSGGFPFFVPDDRQTILARGDDQISTIAERRGDDVGGVPLPRSGCPSAANPPLSSCGAGKSTKASADAGCGDWKAFRDSINIQRIDQNRVR